MPMTRLQRNQVQSKLCGFIADFIETKRGQRRGAGKGNNGRHERLCERAKTLFYPIGAALAGRPVAQPGLFLPRFKAVDAAKMQHVILRVRQFDGIRRDFLEAGCTTDNLTTLVVAALSHYTPRRGTVFRIHAMPP
jgi:hypothetical protein